ncbi:MAG: hypothetical protein ABFD64_12340 [Armatimonadota bacterium]
MNLRVLYGSLGVVCIIALTIAGFGWYIESQRAPEVAKKQVYCNLDELVSSHPAWKQLVLVREMMLRNERSVRFKNGNASLSRGMDFEFREPAVLSESRASLQSRLEKRSQQEMQLIRLQLENALEKRLNERRQDLEAQASAAEAEERRKSEQKLAVDLRALNEEQQYERVDTAIKLYALKAQLSVEGLSSDAVKQSIASRESEFDSIKAKLTQNENDLVSRMAAKSLKVGEERRKSAENELESIRDDETRRINDLIRKKRERFRYELVKNNFNDARMQLIGSCSTEYGRENAVVSCAPAELVLKYSAIKGGDEASALEKSLRCRIHSELETVVRRIARQNGMNVVFKNTGEVEDRTDWFRERLPYLPSRVKKDDRH